MPPNEQICVGEPVAFANEMKKLINQKETSDIRFVIGPTRKAIHAHRCILAARCDVFRAMFSDQTQKHKDGDVPFVLSEMSPDVFHPVLEYIYTNTVTLHRKIAVDVMGTAIEYGLDGLTKLCVSYLIETLSVNSACEAMQAGVTYGQDDLRRKATAFIEDHSKDVFQTKGFLEMSDTALAKLIQSNKLTITELDLLAAVKAWATTNSAAVGKSAQVIAKKVIVHVRLPLLSPQQLKDVETENKKDKIIPVDHLASAWRYHALNEEDKANPLTHPRRGTLHKDESGRS